MQMKITRELPLLRCATSSRRGYVKMKIQVTTEDGDVVKELGFLLECI